MIIVTEGLTAHITSKNYNLFNRYVQLSGHIDKRLDLREAKRLRNLLDKYIAGEESG